MLITQEAIPEPNLMLEVNNLSVVYNNGQLALSNASFSLGSGMICALVGSNGSGKSTLFKSIMGFIKPTTGEVKIGGETIKAAHKRSVVAYVPQTEEVDWSFPVNVWDVVLMGRYGYMNFLRIPSLKDKEIALDALTRVGMADYRDRQIGELSGGQKKRIFLARALAQQGKLILLDEPFTGVDVKTEARIIELLQALKEAGNTILVSTHNLGTIPEYCDHVIMVNQTIIAFGKTEKTFNKENLALTFGGALRNLHIDHTDVKGAFKNEFFVLTDDESALILREDGTPQKRQ